MQLAVLVQHREACRSVLCFLTRLLEPSTALAKLRQQQQQRQVLAGTALDTSAASTALLQSQLDRVGPNLSRMLMGAVVGALPYSRVADIAPVLQVGVAGAAWLALGSLHCVAMSKVLIQLHLPMHLLRCYPSWRSVPHHKIKYGLVTYLEMSRQAY